MGIPASATVLGLVGLGLLSACSSPPPGEPSPTVVALAESLRAEKQLRRNAESANHRLGIQLEESRAQARGDLPRWEVESLRERGLEDPNEDLRRSLLGQTRLLPSERPMGSAWFFEEGEIRLLPAHYVWASATEGHLGAWMLLRYEVSRTGEITWETVWSEPLK